MFASLFSFHFRLKEDETTQKDHVAGRPADDAGRPANDAGNPDDDAERPAEDAGNVTFLAGIPDNEL